MTNIFKFLSSDATLCKFRYKLEHSKKMDVFIEKLASPRLRPLGI